MRLAIGTITMLLSSTMAMATYDLKQVWAYSTISQLGFMVMGLAAGGYFAGVFHLTTHAGFKALLFLCSGIFIHEYHTNDMRVIGQGGGRKLDNPDGLYDRRGTGTGRDFPRLAGSSARKPSLEYLPVSPTRSGFSPVCLAPF